MKTVIIYGTERKGNTYNLVSVFKKSLNIINVTEFYLPKDMPSFCIGCNNCFMQGEESCPHQEYVAPIRKALVEAALIIIASPTYVLHVSAQMKALIDHLAFLLMPHRPEPAMFHKKALVVSTVAGAGIKGAIKYMVRFFHHLGISRVYSLGAVTGGKEWKDIEKTIQPKVKRISSKILSSCHKTKIKLSVKFLFMIMRGINKKGDMIPYDTKYWKKQGWLDNIRPWKKNHKNPYMKG